VIAGREVRFVKLISDDSSVFTDWKCVLEVAGQLMEVTEDCPRRYRVREFPNSAALEAIGLGEL
jgi:hypothetical protein